MSLALEFPTARRRERQLRGVAEEHASLRIPMFRSGARADERTGCEIARFRREDRRRVLAAGVAATTAAL